MERGIGTSPLRCAGRTHAVIVDGRVVRIRCTERNCPDAMVAKERGEIAIHVYDLYSRNQWTEYETRRKEK